VETSAAAEVVTYPGGVRQALLRRLRLSSRQKVVRRVADPDPAGGFFPLHKYGKTRTSLWTTGPVISIVFSFGYGIYKSLNSSTSAGHV